MKMLLFIWCTALMSLTTDHPHTSTAANSATAPASNSTTVMSYNIDLEDPKAMVSWNSRRNIIAQIIRIKKPEILGIQESTPSQTNWLSSNVDGYEWYALGDDKDSYQQEMCPIFYKTSKFTKLDQGSFWLPGPLTETENRPKTVNWLALMHKETGKKIHVFNTQFHKGDNACQNSSARLLKERIDVIADGGTFIILGDLNCPPESEPISWMKTWAQDSHESCLVHTSKADHTFHSWQKSTDTSSRLDYVLLSKDIPANSYEVVDLQHKGSYPSDHLPVYCRLRFK